MKQLSSIIGAAVIACGVALAQTTDSVVVSQSGQTTVKLPPEGMAGGLGVVRVDGIGMAKFGLIGPVVKGAPYAADGVTEMTQTLADGTHIHRQDSYTIYRDGEGRIRRESGDQVWISDPVAKVSYVLDTKQQTARKMSLEHNMVYQKMSSASDTAKIKAEVRAGGPVMFSTLGVQHADSGKTEALGKQVMEGVQVDGTRTTTEIPQGQIGNDRPLQMVHERWESPDLHVAIQMKHTDPMMGEHVERLTNVRRGEPDPALFQVPAGYQLESDN